MLQKNTFEIYWRGIIEPGNVLPGKVRLKVITENIKRADDPFESAFFVPNVKMLF